MPVYLESPSTDPYFNLALEQYVFDHLPRTREYFMLWQNDNAVIVGRHQNTAAEVDAAYVRAHDIKVVRRLSGGGAVYHDLGNLNFTFVTDAAGGAELDLALFCRPVADALARLGVPAQLSGRNDLIIDGMKCSGSAQYRREGRVMHHGTLLFDSDLSAVAGALTVSEDKLQSKGVASVRSRVTSIKTYLKGDVTLSEFKSLLLEGIFAGAPMERYDFTPADLAGAAALRDARYATWDWNWGASPAHVIHKRRRVEGCGTVEVFMDVDRGRITALDFRGDYFGADEAGALAGRLVGCPPEEGALRAALAGAEVGQYFTGLTAEHLIEILTQ